MANNTVKDAKSIRGLNPQYLVEKIIRSRIYDSKYWKEECFALTAELLVDKAMELRFIGGVFGANIKSTPFLCLVLKMLQIQPEKDIILEFIKNDEFKYVRALGAFYMRLTGTSLDCYRYLEPILNDYRKLRKQNRQGQFELIYMDEFIEDLLREDRCCDIILPRVQKRHVLEENNELDSRLSVLEDDIDENLESSEDEETPLITKRKRADDYDRDMETYGHREKKHCRNDRKDRGRSRSSSTERRGRGWHRERENKRHSRGNRIVRVRSRSRSRDRRDRDRRRQ